LHTNGSELVKFNGRVVVVGIDETEVDILEVVEVVQEDEDELGNRVEVESFDEIDVVREDDVTGDTIEFDDAREIEEHVLDPKDEEFLDPEVVDDRAEKEELDTLMLELAEDFLEVPNLDDEDGDDELLY